MSENPILITGSAGRIGRAAVAELTSRGHRPRGFDRVPHATLKDQVIGDLLDAKALATAMTGVHTLIHLAATPDDTDDFVGDVVPSNIVGVYNVLEAARTAGVKRIILASSVQVVWHQRLTGPFPIAVDTSPTPRSWYAATKMFLEGAGRAYAQKHRVPVLAARISWCPRSKKQVAELTALPIGHDIYLSGADAGRFFACAVEKDWAFSFAVVYVASKPLTQSIYDLETTRRLVGYEPRDQWPIGIEEVS